MCNNETVCELGKCMGLEKEIVMQYTENITISWCETRLLAYYNNVSSDGILSCFLVQCPKLSFYFVHSQGALPIKLSTRKLLHAPSQYIAIINGSKTCTHRVHTS